MAKTAIEWIESTWNPVASCTKVSSGCKHCYAERIAKRLQAIEQPTILAASKLLPTATCSTTHRGGRSPRWFLSIP